MDDELDPRERMLADGDQREWEKDEAHKCALAIYRIRTGMATIKDADVLDRNLRFK